MLHRHHGAPRLIEWTGERCLPWAPDASVVYEHMHRYLWAAEIVGGRRVLEVGSGEGFGAAILAGTAAEVVGIDIDELTVEHSQVNYAQPGISFQLGDARDLKMFEPDSFGAVVAFEVIEHFAEQEQALAEIARVLARDGVLLISTPDRRIYSEAPAFDNPFHVRELNLDEFDALIASRFRHRGIWGQQRIAGSQIARLDQHRDAGAPSAGAHADFFIERVGDEWRAVAPAKPTYLLAVASQSRLDVVVPTSTLADPKLELVRTMEDEVVALRDNVSDRDALVRQLQAEITSLNASLADTRQALAGVERSLLGIEQSVSYQLVEKLRARVYGVIGRESVPARMLQAMLRRIGRIFLRTGGR